MLLFVCFLLFPPPPPTMSLDQRSMKSLLAGSKSAHFAAFPQQTRKIYQSFFFFLRRIYEGDFMSEVGRVGGGHFDVQPGFTELLLSFNPSKAALVTVVGCD